MKHLTLHRNRASFLLPALLLSVLLATLMLSGAESALAVPKGASAKCYPKNSKTLSGSSTVRVFRTAGGNDYTCCKKTGKRYKVSPDDTTYGVSDQYKLKERYFGYQTADISCGKFPQDTTDCYNSVGIVLVDAKTGKEIASTAVGGQAHKFFVTTDGTLIIARHKNAPATDGEILVIKRGTPAATIDSGAIDPTSVKLSGRELSWVKAEQPAATTI